MTAQRIMLMSGFLGSGKTTAMVAFAKELESRGMKAALITNDLGENLVDTSFVSCNGVPVLEISNGCLCHDVPQLVEKLDAHIASVGPDIILFEPVGSCVNMVINVYAEILKSYAGRYDLAPVSALVDPVRYPAIYMGKGADPLPEKISYMFRKQLEEADLLLISKADTLTEGELDAIQKSLNDEFPGVPVLAISSYEAKGIAQWADHALSHESSVRDLDIDMDVVMEGAADMGWYNWAVEIELAQRTDVAQLCLDYLKRVQEAFAAEGAEIAHAKVIASQDDAFCRAALTSCGCQPNTFGELKECEGAVELNINIRAVMAPGHISQIMEGALSEVLDACQASMTKTLVQSFTSVEEPPAPRASECA